MAWHPPDDPYVINTTVPLIVVAIAGGIFFGATIGSWVAGTDRPVWKSLLMGSIAGVIIALVGASLISPGDPFLISTSIPIAIRWYGAIIATGAAFASWLTLARATHRGYHPDQVWNQLFLVFLFGIIGARLYYVVFEWDRFGGNLWAMINIANGGLAIHGALIGFMLAKLLYAWRNKIDFLQWADIFVPGILLAQGIGRWGNFFNQEAYGVPTALPFGVRIDQEYRLPAYPMSTYPPDTLFHATFLYESLWNLVGTAILLIVDWKAGNRATGEQATTPSTPSRRTLYPGDLLFLYLIIYSSGRIWIEGLRTDSLMLGPIRVAQLVSLVLIVGGILGLVLNRLLRRRNERVLRGQGSSSHTLSDLTEHPSGADHHHRK